MKQHVTGKEHDFFAIVQPGFEDTAQRELAGLGITAFGDPVEGGIAFRTRLDGCFRVNLCSRTVSRVIMRLCRFRAERFNSLRSHAADFPWELHVKNGTALNFEVTAIKSRLYHKEGIEREFRKGIASRLGDFGIEAGSGHVAGEGRVQKIFVRFDDNICQVSLDTSGELLYRRGIKTGTAAAPMRETLAASILLEAGLPGYDLLIDPMCGSGTFSIEALGILLKKPPGSGRDFAFMNWPSYRPRSFDHMKKKLDEAGGDGAGKKILVLASDISPENMEIAEGNLARSGTAVHAETAVRDFFRDMVPVPPRQKALIVLNPPYGGRLKGINLNTLYRKIGETIRNAYPASGYAVISPSLEYEKIMSLSYDKKILFRNGGIKVAVIIKYV